ncbi:sperm surface protein Sp17 isoform X1 [Zootoca vivipara]|uniref:sperm surface protein Sp17 isoform X1 n=1 Tax=Zootoca vivipara TaxID=8524 RepID=UPI0015907BA9|nr:sperm surface protein Sp17 isoform X1 [Zootoca vivipara]XP_034995316.1 sperm surface protein Sp17 isoform X1 [Zootoca vivipara]XP_034995317.1 sperm surface protein Sp17 isoform X1 [Zootoca vivipara]XP_034995318.1 sperm surface protein Sp17 isoform X1 [Zootoca vivipara]
MSIPFSNTTQRIPAGFANLLEGLAREVLRSQPVDIPSFAAKYFETLLIEREKSGYDPCEWGAKIEDRFYNNHAFNELAPPGGGDKAEEKKEGSGAQPEGGVEKPAVGKSALSLTEDEAATKIQATFRGYRSRRNTKTTNEGLEEVREEKEPRKEEKPSEPEKKEPQ